MRILLLPLALCVAYGQTQRTFGVTFEGTVIEYPSSKPLEGVVVTASETGSRRGATTTDGSGRFVLECPGCLEARLSFSKTGYDTHGDESQIETFKDAEGNIVRIRMVREMWALATITGQVLERDGRPASKATVTWETAAGRLRQGKEVADQQGHFEFNLVPGSYRMCAQPEYAISRPWKSPESGAARIVPVAACFPSTISRNDSTVIQVAPGEKAKPLQIRLHETAAYTLEGRITLTVQKTPNLSVGVYAIPEIRPEGVLPGPEYYAGRVDQTTGQFTVAGVEPGTYTLLARAAPLIDCDTCPLPPPFQAVTPLEVTRDISAIQLTIHPNCVVTGRLSTDGEPGPRRERYVSLWSGLQGFGPGLSGRVAGTGEFRIEHVPPGEYTVLAASAFESVGSILQDGQPIQGERVRVRPGSSPNLEITLRRPLGTVRVQIEGDRNQWPSEHPTVVAIREDSWDRPRSWTRGIVSDATIQLRLPPGSYLLFVTENLMRYSIEDWRDEFKRRQGEAARVIVKEGSTDTVKVSPIILDRNMR